MKITITRTDSIEIDTEDSTMDAIESLDYLDLDSLVLPPKRHYDQYRTLECKSSFEVIG